MSRPYALLCFSPPCSLGPSAHHLPARRLCQVSRLLFTLSSLPRTGPLLACPHPPYTHVLLYTYRYNTHVSRPWFASRSSWVSCTFRPLLTFLGSRPYCAFCTSWRLSSRPPLASSLALTSTPFVPHLSANCTASHLLTLILLLMLLPPTCCLPRRAFISHAYLASYNPVPLACILPVALILPIVCLAPISPHLPPT